MSHSAAQYKLEVIDPSTGEETFLIVRKANDRHLIPATEAIRFQVCNLTRHRYYSLLGAGSLQVYSFNGAPRRSDHQVAYLCIHELEKALVPSRQPVSESPSRNTYTSNGKVVRHRLKSLSKQRNQSTTLRRVEST